MITFKRKHILADVSFGSYRQIVISEKNNYVFHGYGEFTLCYQM